MVIIRDFLFIFNALFILTSERIIEQKSVEDPHPPEHLKGVRIEASGAFNKDYLKEILFGNEFLEIITEDSVVKIKELLEKLFPKIDTNNDEKLSHVELVSWITNNIKAHLKNSAVKSNDLFDILDCSPKDGYVVWAEYVDKYLDARGYSADIRQKWITGQNSGDAVKIELDHEFQLVKDKEIFTQHDEDSNTKLNKTEFLHFLHPEECKESFLKMQRLSFDRINVDGDEHLTLKEFVSPQLPHYDLEQVDLETLIDQDPYLKERRHEFKDVVDVNHDGVVNFDEFVIFNSVENPHMADHDAWSVIIEADNDGDSFLTLDEVLGNFHAFIGSKALDPGRAMHVEF